MNNRTITLPYIIPPYYLCGDWHVKVLRGFDDCACPIMEYFKGKTETEVIQKAKKFVKNNPTLTKEEN